MGDDLGFTIGSHHRTEHRASAEAVAAFAGVSGDRNPLHLDPAYAAQTRFGQPIAHGVLALAFVSAAVTALAGPARTAVYLEQSARFLKPVMVGDAVTVDLEVTAWDPAKRRAALATTVLVGDTPVMSGAATILFDPFPNPPR
jgi:3-hydroxybutyryl-CoA dehydratase